MSLSPTVKSIQDINRIGTPVKLVRAFGGREKYLQAVRELEVELYQATTP